MRIVPAKRLTERGDTIVEVLIAISVMSLLIGGAFVLTNRSLQGTRAAQERLNALKLVESQLEQIKNFAADPTTSDLIFGSATPASFCINSSGAVRLSSDSTCKMGISGNPTTTEPIFNLSVSRSGNTFTVVNSWNNSRGSGQDNVEMKYKVYE